MHRGTSDPIEYKRVRFGINTLLWTAAFDSSHLPLLASFREWGFEVAEIARFSFNDFPAPAIRKELEANQLTGVFCSALTGDMQLCSPDQNVRLRTRRFLIDGIRTASEMGSKLFIGPFCSAVGLLPGRRRTEDEWKYTVEELQALGPVLANHDVRLAIEPLNRFETYFLNTTADAVRLCRAAGDERIGILFDTFHSNIEDQDIRAAVASAGNWLLHVHASENDRGTPGSGHVPFDAVVQQLRNQKYGGDIVIESFGSAIPEIAAAACVWRDLARSPEELARGGLSYLESLR